jgi:hypothetical protein
MRLGRGWRLTLLQGTKEYTGGQNRGVEKWMKDSILSSVLLLFCFAAAALGQTQPTNISGNFSHANGSDVTKGRVFLMNRLGYERFTHCASDPRGDVMECAMGNESSTGTVSRGRFTFDVLYTGDYWLVGVCTEDAQRAPTWVASPIRLDNRDQRQDLRLQGDRK